MTLKIVIIVIVSLSVAVLLIAYKNYRQDNPKRKIDAYKKNRKRRENDIFKYF